MKAKILIPAIIISILIVTSISYAWDGNTWGPISRQEITNIASEMIDSLWIPYNTIYNWTWDSRTTFEAGTFYRGMAYCLKTTPDNWDEFFFKVNTTSGGDTDYGNDCSGFVSISWKLPSRYITSTFESSLDGSYFYALGAVGRGEYVFLLQGDALNESGSHIILFDYYTDSGMVSMEQTPSNEMRRYWSWSSLSTYRPIRRSLVDDGFQIGDRIEVRSDVNVRACASLSCNPIWIAPKGAKGTIVEGPQSADKYRWWRINYDDGVTGWSVEGYLQKISYEAPPAPTNVQATNGTYTDKVRITWSSSSGATSYEVYRATSSGGTKSKIGTPSGTSYDDTSASIGTTYYYWVKAKNSYGTSGYSTYNTGYRATPTDTTPPDTSITGGPSGTITCDDATFTYTGSDDVTSTSNLVYSYKLDGYDSSWSSYTTSTSKSYNDLPNASYTFCVRAKDQAGNFDASPASRSFTVNCSATLSYITISGSPQVNENSEAQYTCTAYYSDGNSFPVTNSASWSENSDYATISSGGGYLTTYSVSSDQSCRITASYGGKSDTHDVTIKNVSQDIGSIRVSIVPQEAADAGAQWRVVGESSWRNSGTIKSNVQFGTYTIEFKDISGWITPSNKVVTLFAANPDPWINSDPYVDNTQTCTYSISHANKSFDSTGGSDSVSVTTQNDCPWSAVSYDDWITITSGNSGSGNGAVDYSVTSNSNASLRTGTMTIARKTFTVTQDGVSCTYSISPTSQSFSSSGGTGTVSVTTESGCDWTASSNYDWITITSDSGGNGDGTVGYSVLSNSSTSSRTGTMTIAGETFTVTQGDIIGYWVTSDLWIRAVINTVEKGPIDAIWRLGGQDTTSRGDTVIWGHFYASPSDVTWGSSDNPDLFVKIWFDVSGRVDVNYFHVSVPDIEVYSDYPYDGSPDEQGITTMSRRYIRQFYENGQSYSEENYEDGNPPAGYWPTGNPAGYHTINDLRIGSIINTVEKGPIDAVWRFGGQNTTSRGDEVVWGHFYADPLDVTWGSQDNPDLFVKIWFDVSGRVDVNYFHVSVPDIEVYSDLPDDSTYDQKGTTIMDNRYIRHEYWR